MYKMLNMLSGHRFWFCCLQSFYLTLGGTAPMDLIFDDFVHFLKKCYATLDKVSYGSGHKCSKELTHYSFTTGETIVVKLQ